MIAHLDLDAFFAAVEQLRRPELRGRPVIVGGDPHGRGVVATASYEARAFGIGSAMASAEALRRCPEAVFVTPDHDAYRTWSRRVWAVVGERVEHVERVGIDEGYLDMSHAGGDAAAAERLLVALQEAVRESTSLTCSLGCGTGKTVAKIASDRRKPGGILVVAPGHEADFLAPLPVRLLPGVGPRSEERLLAAGVRTVGDLAALGDGDLARLTPGKVGLELRERARGVDERQVVSEPVEPISISYEDTFEHDLRDGPELRAELRRQAEALAGRLERNGVLPCTVTVKVRYSDFRIATRSLTRSAPVVGADELEAVGLLLLERAFAARDEPIRLLGLGGAKLVREAQLSLPLDGAPADIP